MIMVFKWEMLNAGVCSVFALEKFFAKSFFPFDIRSVKDSADPNISRVSIVPITLIPVTLFENKLQKNFWREARLPEILFVWLKKFKVNCKIEVCCSDESLKVVLLYVLTLSFHLLTLQFMEELNV